MDRQVDNGFFAKNYQLFLSNFFESLRCHTVGICVIIYLAKKCPHMGNGTNMK